MTIENVALINELGQVVNHIVVDTDDTETMANLHEYWGTVRYVATKESDVIIIDESPKIWTTHTEEDGFVLPVHPNAIVEPSELEIEHLEVNNSETVKINGRVYPTNSLLIKENALKRPQGYSLPEGEVEVSLDDVE